LLVSAKWLLPLDDYFESEQR